MEVGTCLFPLVSESIMLTMTDSQVHMPPCNAVVRVHHRFRYADVAVMRCK